MTVLFSNVPMLSVFKYNNILYVRTGTDTARKVCGGNVITIPLYARVMIF